MKNYTASGKFMFNDVSAEFGVNFYSKWTSSAKRYCMLRSSWDDSLRLYYYPDSITGNRVQLGGSALDGIIMSWSDVWYNFKIKVATSGTSNSIYCAVWKDGETDPTASEPPQWQLFATHTDTTMAQGGTVGITVRTGTGTKSWHALHVVSNTPPQGAYMAYETFARDTVVDVKPYTPANWSATYGSTQFPVTFDTTGFSLDTTGGEQALVYRHKPGATYPVTCKLRPYSNLEWRDYEFSGTIIKPAGAEYDSIGIGAVVYAEAPDRYYSIKVRGLGNGGNGFVLVRTVGTSDSLIDTLEEAPVFQGSVDTVHFAVRVLTDALVEGGTTYSDSVIHLQAQAWLQLDDKTAWSQIEGRADAGDKRQKSGPPALQITRSPLSEKLLLNSIKVQKAR